ncbi:MAG: DUF1289 domain-containing protein [Nitrososphaera sp.]
MKGVYNILHIEKSQAMKTSLCKKYCKLDESGTRCLVCLRTLQEITDWPTMSEAEKQQVKLSVAKRRRTYNVSTSS